MSGANVANEHKLPDKITQQDEADIEVLVDDQKQLDEKDQKALPSASNEEEMIKKKYGGMLPKKPPLISKDHEHAFFDSADWAMGKQGSQKPKGPLEILRPKLQPTAHHQENSRLSAYSYVHPLAPTDAGKDGTFSEQYHVSFFTLISITVPACSYYLQVTDDIKTKNGTGDADDQDFLVDEDIKDVPSGY